MSIRYYFDRGTGTELVTCLSTDTKPASANGVSLIEQDTGKIFYRLGGAWVERGNSIDVVGNFLTMGAS